MILFKIKYSPNKAFFILLLFVCRLCFSQELSLADSLRLKLKETGQDTIRVNTLNKLSWELKQSGEYEEALVLNTEAFMLAKQLRHKRGIIVSYLFGGSIYTEKGEFVPAIEKFSAGLEIALHPENTYFTGRFYNNIGIVYRNQGNYPEALRYYLLAMKVKEQTKDTIGIAGCHSNIGVIFLFQNEYKKAMTYFLKALKIYEQKGQAKSVTNTWSHLGYVFRSQKKYESARNCFITMLSRAKKSNSPSFIISAYDNLGVLASEEKDYKNALENHLSALEIAEKINAKQDLSTVLVNVGTAYKDLKQYLLAETYLLKALELEKEVGDLEIARAGNEVLATIYEVTNKPEKAFLHYKKFIAARDSLTNEESTKKIVQSEMTYNFEKKELTVKAEQEKKDEIAKQEQEKQKVIRNAFIGGFALILALAVFIFRSYRQKRRSNIVITRQKEEVEARKKMVENQKELIEEKQKEILDSIHYARRIQAALLTPEKYIDKSLARLSESRKKS